jgi:hypothetical protein
LDRCPSGPDFFSVIRNYPHFSDTIGRDGRAAPSAPHSASPEGPAGFAGYVKEPRHKAPFGRLYAKNLGQRYDDSVYFVKKKED